MRGLSAELACAPLERFACRLVSPSFAARRNPARCPEVAGDRQVPRVPLPSLGVTSAGVMCATTSSGVTPSSSLIRTHASDHPPLPDFSCSPYTESPCRLPSAPAGEWSFPTLSLCSPCRMNAPGPRCLPWLLLPVSSHGTSAFLEREERVGDHNNPHSNFSADPHFAVLGEFLLACSILRFCLPPRLLLPQWLNGHWAAVVFTSKQNTCRYLHVIWICLPPESGNSRREDFHLSSYSVLSAAHPSRWVPTSRSRRQWHTASAGD